MVSLEIFQSVKQTSVDKTEATSNACSSHFDLACCRRPWFLFIMTLQANIPTNNEYPYHRLIHDMQAHIRNQSIEVHARGEVLAIPGRQLAQLSCEAQEQGACIVCYVRFVTKDSHRYVCRRERVWQGTRGALETMGFARSLPVRLKTSWTLRPHASLFKRVAPTR